jgi:hypothetical protein
MAEENVSVTERVVARRIFNRTRELLANPESIDKIVDGRYPGLSTNYDREKVDNMTAEMSAMGYSAYINRSTQQAKLMSKIDRETEYVREGGEPAKVDELHQCREELEDQFTQVAMGTIVAGLQDGSIPMDFASQTDEQIIQALIDSDGTKERTIESQMKPIRENISDKVDTIVYGPAPIEGQ